MTALRITFCFGKVLAMNVLARSELRPFHKGVVKNITEKTPDLEVGQQFFVFR